MGYKTYTTKALVCGSRDSYTSDRSYLLFTRNAGMLWATARSVREEKSKQRNALQDFSFIKVSLVKGKSGWRIGSVEAQGNSFLSSATRERRGLVSYIVMQLRRYVHGESPLIEVYDDVEIVLKDKLKQTDIATVQTVFLIRMLHILGYIAPKESFSTLLTSVDIDRAVKVYDADMLPIIEKALKKASQMSHL